MDFPSFFKVFHNFPMDFRAFRPWPPRSRPEWAGCEQGRPREQGKSSLPPWATGGAVRGRAGPGLGHDCKIAGKLFGNIRKTQEKYGNGLGNTGLAI